jgi:hypothetical protein
VTPFKSNEKAKIDEDEANEVFTPMEQKLN